MEKIEQQAAKKLMCTLVFTLILSVMSATMFNIVLPEIASDFQLSKAQVSWVSSSYMLIYGIGTVIYGKLSDFINLKKLLAFGLSIFVLGSITGLLSQAYWMVLFGRILQAMGAAVIPAIAMIIPVRFFPPEKRGQALGMSASGLALGNALGPIVSAFIVSVVHWRWLFCLPILLLLTLPFYFKYLDDHKGNRSKFDWIGGCLLAGMITMLLLSVTNGSWTLFTGGLVVFILFVLRIHYADEPFVSVSLFQNKRFSIGLFIAFLVSAFGFSIPFLSPLLLADVNHLNPGWIGLVIVPGAIVTALMGRIGGKLADKKGNNYLFITAWILLAINFSLMSSFAGISPVWIAVFLVFGSVGQSFMLIVMSNSISRTLSKKQIGVGMGIFQMLNFIAGSVAGAVYGKTIDIGAIANFNPINVYPEAAIYSNIYLALTVLLGFVALIYYFNLSKEKKL
ncbi:MFS transporter [Oceanobacillus jeddahense]|uniref:MFS transporter n=1 Tax=Oceanobacillus jeddahense TaxID=1462527 RepID=UPI003628D952